MSGRGASSPAKRWIAWSAAALAVFVLSAARLDACTIVSALGPNFGAYNALTPTPVDSTGSVTLQCAPSTKNIRVDLSAGSSGTYAGRTLRNGANTMLYNLYRDATLTSVWGDGTGGTSFLFIGNWSGGPHTPQTHVIYGRIPALQDVAAGSYTDTIVVTVQF
jgi:spore coat protein U-like protein